MTPAPRRVATVTSSSIPTTNTATRWRGAVPVRRFGRTFPLGSRRQDRDPGAATARAGPLRRHRLAVGEMPDGHAAAGLADRADIGVSPADRRGTRSCGWSLRSRIRRGTTAATRELPLRDRGVQGRPPAQSRARTPPVTQAPTDPAMAVKRCAGRRATVARSAARTTSLRHPRALPGSGRDPPGHDESCRFRAIPYFSSS